MDKNLKAELSALRNEVTTGLNGLQTLVQNIDTKIKQLEQSPEITVEQAKESEETISGSAADKRSIDNKTILELFKEASHWDELAHEIFVATWNQTRKQRIDSLEIILATLAGDASKHAPNPIKVRDIAEAEAALREMTRYSAAKEKIVNIIRNKDRGPLKKIIRSEDPDNFISYYSWLNEIVDEMLALRENPKRIPTDEESRSVSSATAYMEFYGSERDEVNLLVNNVVSLYRMLMEQHEMGMYDLVVVDPETFQPKRPPEDKLRSFRRRCFNNYNHDLRKAYEFVAKRNKNELDRLVSIATA
jgi:hypothetical protein